MTALSRRAAPRPVAPRVSDLHGTARLDVLYRRHNATQARHAEETQLVTGSEFMGKGGWRAYAAWLGICTAAPAAIAAFAWWPA